MDLKGMSERRITRRKFLKLFALSTVGAASLGAGGFAYAHEIEPDWVDITSLHLALPNLDKDFEGYRLVQISDIHADNWMTPERLAGVVGLINVQEPHLVAITGDFVTSGAFVGGSPRDALRRLVPQLRLIRAHDGVVAVLGNHDYWTDAALVRRVIGESGITELSNDSHSLQRGNSLLHIAGVDDVMEGRARLNPLLDLLPSSGPAILLAHEPDFADESAATKRFDLQISGHSHGGQVSVPLLGPPILPPLAKKYPAGLYKMGGMFQYTNRGLGMLPPRIRLHCRPEITVFTLHTTST